MIYEYEKQDKRKADAKACVQLWYPVCFSHGSNTGRSRYIEHSSEYRRGLSEKLSQVSAVLVPETEIAVNNDDIEGWKLRAMPFMNAFELASISLFEVSPDNSRVLLLADVRPDRSEPERYSEETAGYFRDASPEVSEVLNEITENGSAVSVSDIFNGEYGKVITCYITELPEANIPYTISLTNFISGLFKPFEILFEKLQIPLVRLLFVVL